MSTNSESKICLIYTGGTIGMWPDDDGTLVPPKDPRDFLKVAPDLSRVADFDFIPLMNKDSTNMTPADWTTIAKTIYDKRHNGYTGFVVAHGTDTMHFSASAVAFALGRNLNFPVVFTGSQTDASIAHGDARTNLMRAFMVAKSDIAEVVICFGNDVFRGCRAQKRDESRFDAFESPAFPNIAYITKVINAHGPHKRCQENTEDIELVAEFAPGICQFSLIPGLESNFISRMIGDETVLGIILQSFGAGNVPNDNGFSLIPVIKNASKYGMPILITSQFPANAANHTDYLPGKEASNAGAIPTGNMTSACAMVKFRWVLAQVLAMNLSTEDKMAKIAEMMNRSYIGELDEDSNEIGGGGVLDSPFPINVRNCG